MTQFVVYTDAYKDGTPLKSRKYLVGMLERWPELVADAARAVKFRVRADASAAAARMLGGYKWKVEAVDADANG